MKELQINAEPLKGIKNIIFDLGGVIIGIDYLLTIEKFRSLGLQNFDEIYGQYKQTHIFDLYEKGLSDTRQFRESIERISGVKIQPHDFDSAWNAMILEIPEKNLNLLHALKANFKTFLLSNTNEIHLEYFFKYVDEKHQIKDFGSLFHKVYYSCRLNMRKPDREIFQHVIDENSLVPSETLFIDDTSIHVEGAKKAGIHAYHLKPGEQISELLAAFV